MQITKTNKILGIILILLLLIGFYIAFDRNKNNQIGKTDQTIATSTDISNSSATSTGISVSDKGGGSHKINELPIKENTGVPQPIPDLNRPVTRSSGATISPEAEIAAPGKVLAIQTALKKNPADFESWMTLGVYQKMGGDYEGAVISWQYATRLFPAAYTPFGNLADIYAYFLKDSAKAELYYKEAISKGITQAYLYTQLAEFYRDLLKDNAKALVVVNQGLTQLPNDPNLIQLKTSLQ